MLHIPVVLCAVVPLYNVKELNDKPPLKFSGEVLGDIYLGKITKWNDPAIKALNPELKDVLEKIDTKIVAVHRSDSSGTTFIFTDYLAGKRPASPAWKEQFKGPQSVVQWPPVGVGKERNTGVTQYVKETEGAIGYVDMLHAIDSYLPFGAVKNSEGKFISASGELRPWLERSKAAKNPEGKLNYTEALNITAAAKALGNTDISEDLTFTLTNMPGKDSYPICSAIWAVCYQKQPGDRQQQVSEFLNWVLHDGQKFAAVTSYAPLPEEIVRRAEERMKLIQTGS